MRHPFARSALTLFPFVALASNSRAQGSDDCSTPQTVHGTGAFPFDSGAATTGGEGQGYGACFSLGTASIERDVWFVWTSPQDGDVTIATCGLTAIDSKIALYSGIGCPASPPIGCSDDACGFQSRVDFHALLGRSYTIQIGSFPGALGGVGSFSIEYAPGLPGCLTGTGPDVVLGDIVNVFNAPAEGAIDALAVGSTACNVGTSPVDWNGSVGASPVIRQNLFRYKIVDGSGRFEQVGLSWLKHGFFAASDLLCCSFCQGTDGTSLGVGCSDTYTAELNGTQSLLGPRHEVDPYTGSFPYPPTNPSGGNTGRLQVDIGDLEASSANGTRYFGSCQYIAADDALAGNANNNCSYREVSVSGSGTTWSFGFTGTTQRELPAIQAWKTCESGVTTTDVQIPNEGLLILGYKTTDLGGGVFHYEYALYNMNSDLGASRLSIPVPSGVTVMNVGFHDVTYRGGDGFGGLDQDGTDWDSSNVGGMLSWSTLTFVEDPNSNAIRWGTTYTFRFDANSAPMTGTISIGTFKDGGTVQTSGDVPGGSTPPGTPFCFGDLSAVTPCPCANTGVTEHGCENSGSTGGAVAYTAGSLDPDGLLITAAGERTTALSVLIQGDANQPSGSVFGDGLLCLNGTLKRIGTKSAVGGVVTYPQSGDTGIRRQSAKLGDVIPPGGVRFYQFYYRDPSSTFCPAPTGDTFNASSGVIVTWP
jgi:hypothetical protein